MSSGLILMYLLITGVVLLLLKYLEFGIVAVGARFDRRQAQFVAGVAHQPVVEAAIERAFDAEAEGQDNAEGNAHD